MEFTFDQAFRYYSYRLDAKLTTRDEQTVRCPFHGDRTASMALKLPSAEWYCHACKIGGGVYQFEAHMFPSQTPDQNWEKITKICGLEPHTTSKKPRGPLIATHLYQYADGKVAFEKMRYGPPPEGGGKTFVSRMPKDDGWVYNLRDIAEKPLYRLPDIVKSNVVMITEGELKADALNAIPWEKLTKPNGIIPRVAATCNFDGAGKWLDSYSIYMAGKKVLIFPDNDEIGKNHARAVAKSVSKYAASVHILDLPGLEEHGDVVDYLAVHPVADLITCLRQAKQWKKETESAEAEQPWLVSATRMVVDSATLNWLVPGVVHTYSKGIFVAMPKAGKSLVALDMAVALASRQSWCGCPAIDRQIRCAVISREDPSFLTQKRTFDFARGRGLIPGDIEEWIFFNTRDQSRNFYLESDENCGTAIKWIKEKGVEFAIFDVLNLIHNANENSNTEMTAVMKRLSYIRDETNIALALIHHTPHSDPKRARGAGAIESWWEWKVVVSPDPDDDATKNLSFISKACRPHPPIQLSIQEQSGGTILMPSKVSPPPSSSYQQQTWQQRRDY